MKLRRLLLLVIGLAALFVVGAVRSRVTPPARALRSVGCAAGADNPGANRLASPVPSPGRAESTRPQLVSGSGAIICGSTSEFDETFAPGPRVRLVSIGGGASWGATFELVDDEPPAEVVLASPSTFVVLRGGLRYFFASMADVLHFAAEGETVHAFCGETDKTALARAAASRETRIVIRTEWTIEGVYAGFPDLLEDCERYQFGSYERNPDRY